MSRLGKSYTSVGQYINIYDDEGNYDVYIHLHESSDPLTPDDVDAIEKIVVPMMENDDSTIATDEMQGKMGMKIENYLHEDEERWFEVLVTIVKRYFKD